MDHDAEVHHHGESSDENNYVGVQADAAKPLKRAVPAACSPRDEVVPCISPGGSEKWAEAETAENMPAFADEQAYP